MSKKLLLSKDLQLNNHFYKTLEGLINHGGGILTEKVEEADIYIGHYRDGDDYMKASRAGKEVANLSWLCYVINCNKYTSPFGKPSSLSGSTEGSERLRRYANQHFQLHRRLSCLP